jgi:hypothetical protein
MKESESELESGSELLCTDSTALLLSRFLLRQVLLYIEILARGLDFLRGLIC